MNGIALALPVVALAGAVAIVSPRMRAPEPGAVVLDCRIADFLEDERGDERGRVIAALEAMLVREGGRTVLRISASAVGPRVDPPPGVRGVQGGNAISAEEIAAIVAGGRTQVRVRGEATGRVAVGREGTVTERRMRADGCVVHVPAGGAGPLEAVFEAPIEGDGDVEIVVDGRVRARARVRGGRVTLLEGASAHGAHP